MAVSSRSAGAPTGGSGRQCPGLLSSARRQPQKAGKGPQAQNEVQKFSPMCEQRLVLRGPPWLHCLARLISGTESSALRPCWVHLGACAAAMPGRPKDAGAAQPSEDFTY